MSKLGRNDPCPCKSGKKVKTCCGLDAWNTIAITPEMQLIFEEQDRKFREKFGRAPGPDDLVFFDAPPLAHVEADTVAAMKAANIRPEIIHAYERTGRLLTEANAVNLTEDDLAEWDDAIEESFELHPEAR